MTVYSWNIACHLRSRPSDPGSELISDPAVVTPNRACLHLVAQGVFSATVSCIDIPVSPPAAISLARLDNSGYETRITPPCIFPSRLSPTDHCALFLLSLMPLHSSRTSLRTLVASALDSERYLFRSTRTGGSNLRYFGCHRVRARDLCVSWMDPRTHLVRTPWLGTRQLPWSGKPTFYQPPGHLIFLREGSERPSSMYFQPLYI